MKNVSAVNTSFLALYRKRNKKNDLASKPLQTAQAQDTFENSAKKSDKRKKIKKIKIIRTIKTIGLIIASSLGTAAITAASVKGRYSKLLSEADIRHSEKLKEATEPLNKEIEQYRARFEELLKDDPEVRNISISENLLKQRRKEIESYELDYNPQSPPRQVCESTIKDNFMDLPVAHIPTKNRENMQKLIIPEFQEGKSWDFEIPRGNMRPIVEKNFSEIKADSGEIGLSLDYADSLKIWDNDKVARDILQNFYDGHNQTLDGVRFNVTPVKNGRYRVRISGDGVYKPGNAVYLGSTTKRGADTNAGGFGEGMKMTTVKLLKEAGANEVRAGSDGWRITYSVGQGKVDESCQVIKYTLEPTAHTNGNFYEFETDKPELINSIRKTINRFYHSGNTDFKCPDFENDLLGIKYLGAGKKGNVYIAGQRFEFDGSWSGLDGLTVFFKEKPPVKHVFNRFEDEITIFNPSRDRVSMSGDNLSQVLRYFTTYSMNGKTTNEDVIKIINILKPIWNEAGDSKEVKNRQKILEGVINAAYERKIKINFPNDYIACSFYMDDTLRKHLIATGYKLCMDNFDRIGMQSLSDFMEHTRNRQVITPNEKEIKKIGIIKKALSTLSKYLNNEKYFTAKELNPKIYLFDAKKGEKLNRDTLAEAITSHEYDKNYNQIDKSLGFWVDQKYLNTASFPDILATALHEITHKVGGDGSADFGYKLTDVLGKLIESRTGDDLATVELKNLNKLWDELV